MTIFLLKFQNKNFWKFYGNFDIILIFSSFFFNQFIFLFFKMPIPFNKSSEFFIPEEKKENVEVVINPLTSFFAMLLNLPVRQITVTDAQHQSNDESSNT